MTELLYKSEHLSCINYEHDTETRILEEKIDSGSSFFITAQVNKIIIVTENAITISSDTITPTLVKSNFMFFVAAGKNVEMSSGKKSAKVLIINLFERISLCDNFPLEDLFKKTDNPPKGQLSNTYTLVSHFHPLKMNTVAKSYLDLLLHCHRLGLKCCNYHKGKINELLFILRAFYSKEELAAFFLLP